MGLTAEDRLEIMDVAARRAYAADWRDGATYANLHTEDGVFIGGHIVEGHKALEEYVNRMSGPAVRHILTNFIIDGDGDSATAQYYWWVYRLTNEGPKPFLTCVCFAKLLKVDGHWKFKEVNLSFDPVFFQ